MIDLHSHVLPGIDDGPPTLDGALEIARAAVDDGIEQLAATPHVRGDWPTTPDSMESGVAALQASLDELEIPLRILPGGELALEQLGALAPADLRRFGLGGSTRYVLVETPYYGWPLDFGERLFLLRAAGFTPVIAHPERSADVQSNPERLAELVRAGALAQVTASSIDGRLGRGPRDASFRLLELGLVHLIASDAHAPAIRGVGLSAAVDAIGDDALGRWLVRDVPLAIVAGTEIPPRPDGARPRAKRGWFRR